MRESPDIGNIRETFVLNQLINSGLPVSAPKEGDFKVNDLIIEVGGKVKNTSQVNHLSNYLVASDDIEVGRDKTIPIWLLGFLY